MNFKEIVIICAIVLVCFLLPYSEGKRSFGITRSRSKNKQHSVRRNSHGNHGDYDMAPVPAPSHPKPSAPDSHSNVNKPAPAGWNVGNNQHGQNPGHHNPNPSGQNTGHQNHLSGPPPAYPGMERNPVSSHGNPPAYSASHANPPSYSSLYSHNNQKSGYGQTPNNQYMQSSSHYGLGNQPGQQQTFYPQQSPYMGNHGNMFGGNANSAMPAYGYGSGHYRQSSPFSLSNMLAGAAIWHVGSSLMGGGRSSHVYHHYDKPEDRENPGQPEITTTLPPSLGTQSPHQLAEYQHQSEGQRQRYGEYQHNVNSQTQQQIPPNNFTELPKPNATTTNAPMWIS